MNKNLGFLILPTLDCNLGCEYCFSKKKNKYMPLSSLYPLFSKIKEFCNKLEIKNLTIYWQGGECLLMGSEWFEEMIQIIKNLFPKEENISITQRIQSNIILYNSSWKKIMKENFGGSIGTSLDYPNLYRKEIGCSVDDFEELWIKKRNEMFIDGIMATPISVINEGSLEIGPREYYNYYTEKLKLKSFQFNFPFTTYTKKEKFNLDKNKLSAFIIGLFEIWWNEGKKNSINVTPFNLFEKTQLDYKNNHLLCIWSKCCSNNFFGIDPDGNVGLCNSWVAGYNDFNYGNIFTDKIEDIINNNNRVNFIKRTEYILDSECLECPYCSLCFGGCPMRAYTASNKINSRDYYCEVYKEMFSVVEYYLRDKKRNKFLLNLDKLKSITTT